MVDWLEEDEMLRRWEDVLQRGGEDHGRQECANRRDAKDTIAPGFSRSDGRKGDREGEEEEK